MASNETVDWMIRQSKRYPLLTPEQEITYGRQVQAWQALKDLSNPTAKQQTLIKRGQRAFNHFYRSNIRLAVAAARRYIGVRCTLDPEDLIQEGLLGLERAIVKFDPARGYKFSTYAFNLIHRSIGRAIDNHGRTIRIPVHGIDRVRQIERYIDSQVALTGEKPTLAQAAQALGFPMDTLRLYVLHFNALISLDQPLPNSFNSSGEMTYLDVVAEQAPKSNWVVESFGDAEELQTAIEQLTPGQRAVIELMYCSDADDKPTLQAVGDQLGIVREAARQKHLRALKALRMQLNVVAA